MKYKELRWLMTIAVAIAGMVGASAALAAVNPFAPSLTDIQSLSDQTAGFHGGQQLSTIDAINYAPDGIHLDITWRVGQNSDPFGPDFG